AISILEMVSQHCVDRWGFTRRTAVLTVSTVLGIIGVFCALSFGPLSDWKLFGRTLFDLLDYATSNIGMPIGCVGIGLVAAWVAWPTIRKQLEMNAKWSAAGLKAFRILAGC
ncbi:MAG TPA: sodium-dependent transporter, partial [Sutterella wadsworthensis]|nr:sodium-dependent transporter [Sutterella wadsworthensis]